MMDYATIEAIVREILRKWEPESANRPDLLVLNASADGRLDQLEKHWNLIKLPLTPTPIPENVRDAVFLDATQDLLVKGALGIADTPESQMLSTLLLRGLRITLIPSAELEWMLDVSADKAANPAYAHHLGSYKKTLEGFGVRIAPLAALAASASRERITFRGKLLTQRDIEQIKEEKIWIRKTTIVTPLARDAAREKGKSICVIDGTDER